MERKNSKQKNEHLKNLVKDYILHDFTRMQDYTPHFMCSGSGCWLEDCQGEKYLDFKSCAFNVNLGYQHPRLVTALKNQADRLCYTDFANLPSAQLTEAILDILPSTDYRVFYCSGGALAVETAIKIARDVSKKQKIISYLKNYHGVTYGAMSVTGWGDIYNSFGATLPHHIKIPPAYCYRCYFGKSYPGCDLQCVEYVEKIIQEENPASIAAVIAEPIPWGEMIVPPQEYWKGIKELCEKYNILLIFDEIVTGFGRCGDWFAFKHYDVTPDIIISGKGLGAGILPLYTTIVHKKVSEYYLENRFTHGFTFQGYPLACAVANEVITTIKEENLLENVKQMNAHLEKLLQKLKEKYPFIGDVRGVGLMHGIEMVADRSTGSPLEGEITQNVIKSAFHNGCILGSAIYNFLTIMPPLVVNKDELEMGCKILDDVMSSVSRQ